MTPRRSSSGPSEATATYAPRSLNAPIGWRDSALSSCPRAGSPNATRGVRAVTPRSRPAAARIRPRPTSGASAGVAAAGDARRRPGDQLLALARDLGAAGLADRVRPRGEACQRVVNRVEPALGLFAQRQVALLGEDVGGRRSLRAVGHLPRRLDLLSELRAQGQADLLETGTGSRGRVGGSGHVHHPTLAQRGPQPRPPTPPPPGGPPPPPLPPGGTPAPAPGTPP